MKLIVAIIQDEDVPSLIEIITSKGFRVTKLASTGGFLKSGNTTLLMGVEDESVNLVLSVIEKRCKTREITASLPSITMTGDTYVPYPFEIKVGGATIFILDVDRYIRF